MNGYADRHAGEDVTDLEALIVRCHAGMKDGDTRRDIATPLLLGGLRRVDGGRSIVLAPHGLPRPFRILNRGRVVLTIDAENPRRPR